MHKAMMSVIDYALVVFRIQDDSDYYNNNFTGKSTKISTSDIIYTINEEFEVDSGFHNVEFEIKDPDAKIKKLEFNVIEVMIH
jgi:hypothetical protein